MGVVQTDELYKVFAPLGTLKPDEYRAVLSELAEIREDGFIFGVPRFEKVKQRMFYEEEFGLSRAVKITEGLRDSFKKFALGSTIEQKRQFWVDVDDAVERLVLGTN